MNIILEGPDNCGKSTLARAIQQVTGWEIKEKEGRLPFPQMLDKIRYYLTLDGLIIDRHPIISQSVYGSMRWDPEIPDELMDAFSAQNNLIIYCRCMRSLQDHEASPTDDEAHLKMIEEKKLEILDIYDGIAIAYANIVYTMYDQTDMVLAMVKGVLAHERG